jgi:putative DNA primase/helicase
MQDHATQCIHSVAVANLIAQCAADVTPEPVQWLWPGRVALGKLTLITGEAGLGKSQISVSMAAAVTTGSDWPCGEGRAPLGNVVILAAEDGVGDTMVPRLMASGANRERVHVVTAVSAADGKSRRAFDLSADLALLERKIGEIGDVRLIIVDPISSYIGGKVDSHANAAVRGMLEPVSEMADRLRTAVVSITHPPKGTGTTAINRFIGSVAFVAAARTAFMVTSDPESETRRLFLPVKNNLAPLGKGLAFQVEQRLVGAPGQGIVASSVAWETEPVSISADQALQALEAQASGEARSAAVEAEAFLRDMLAGGAVAVKELKREAHDAGLSWRTLRRAQKSLGIESARRAERGDGLGDRGRWYWSLPGEAVPRKVATNSYGGHPPTVDTLGNGGHLGGPLGAEARPVQHAEVEGRAPPLVPQDGLDDTDRGEQ